MCPQNRRPLIFDDDTIKDEYGGRANFIAAFIKEWGNLRDWNCGCDVLESLIDTFGLEGKVGYSPNPSWRAIKSIIVNNQKIFMNGNCWYDYNTDEFIHEAIASSNGNQNLIDICNSVLLPDHKIGVQVSLQSVNTTEAKNAKALKRYLESKKMAVPKDVLDKAASCTHDVDWHKATGYISKYLKDHGMCVPYDILSNHNIAAASNFTHNTLFTELWDLYTREYPNQQNFQKILLDCILATAKNLYSHLILGDNRPVLLLGNVQSGKTSAFEKIIALCFDYGFEECIILTKNSNQLLNQTYERIQRDFSSIEALDVVTPSCYDISNRSVLTQIKDDVNNNRRSIIFAKKEITNLERLLNLKELTERKVLIIDDEADNISVGFYGNEIAPEIAACSKAIENLRHMLPAYAYLQVTATCFNIILQPINQITVKDRNGNPIVLSPFCPSEIEILPTYPGYKGADEFFPSCGDSPYWVDFNPTNITMVPQAITKHCLYKPILEYLMATAFLELNSGKRMPTCSLVHTNINTQDHTKIENIIKLIISDIFQNINNLNPSVDFANYINAINYNGQSKNNILKRIINPAFRIQVGIINSQNQFDKTALNNGANIFIGAYMLDRGLTFDHLISFIYGRTSNQQDTVMQHARFFGNRSSQELDLTRLYMTRDMMYTMKKMHQCDKDLRKLIDTTKAGNRWTVLKDSSFEVCARNKILVSDIAVFKNNRTFYTPKGMQIPQSVNLTKIYQTVRISNPTVPDISGIRISYQNALNILDQIRSSYKYADKYGNLDRSGDIDSLKRTISLPHRLNNPNAWKEVIIHFYPNRDLSRNSSRTSGPLQSQGDQWISGVLTGHGNDLNAAQLAANNNNIPVLVLTVQKGQKAGGWLGYQFIWPALVLPYNNKISDYKIVTTTN